MRRSILLTFLSFCLQLAAVAFTTFPATYSQAALRCENVLIASGSDHIQTAIHELAKLKIKVELDKANGDSSPLATALRHDYITKQAELTNLIQQTHAMTPKQLQNLFKQEITKLQKDQLEKDKDEALPRALHSLGVPSYAFVESSQPISDFGGQLAYSQKIDSLVYKNYERQLSIMKYGLEVSSHAGSNVSLFILSKANDQQAWILTNSWELQLVDLASDRIIRSVKLEPGIDHISVFGQLDINPSEKMIAIGGTTGEVIVFDTTTGKQVAAADNKVGYTKPIQGLRFIDDDNVVFNGLRTIHKLDVVANKQIYETLPKSPRDILALEYNNLTRTIIVANYDHVHTLSANDLLPISRNPTFADNIDGKGGYVKDNKPGFTTNIMKAVPNSVGVFMNSPEGDKSYGIFDATSVEMPFSNFLGKYWNVIGNQIADIAFSNDSKLAFVLVRTGVDNSGFATEAAKPKIYVDIWRRDTN